MVQSVPATVTDSDSVADSDMSTVRHIQSEVVRHCHSLPVTLIDSTMIELKPTQ